MKASATMTFTYTQLPEYDSWKEERADCIRN